MRMTKGDRAGFTLIEVMIAMAVIMVGASGLMALQTSTTHSNQDSREHTAALNFASTWLERVKRDAMRWIDRDAGPNQTVNLNWVQGEAPEWFVPTATTAGESHAADFWGFDTDVEADRRFCVNLRRTPLAHLVPGDTTSVPVAMVVEVRVYWHRMGKNVSANISDRRLHAFCGGGASGSVPADAILNNPAIRVVGLSTVVAVNEPEIP